MGAGQWQPPPPPMDLPGLTTTALPQLALGNDSVSHHSRPSVVMPKTRCAVTMSGFSRQVTVSMPRSACMMSVATRASARGTLTRCWRRVRTASTASARMRQLKVPTA